jgi:hypothetical protein
MDDADDAAGHDAQISSSGTVRLERSGLTETEQRIVGKLAREGLVLDEGNSSEASLFFVPNGSVPGRRSQFVSREAAWSPPGLGLSPKWLNRVEQDLLHTNEIELLPI